MSLQPQIWRSLLRGAAIATVVWTVLALLFAGQIYANSALSGRPQTWNQALVAAFADWYVFALLAPPVAWLGRQVRLEWPLRTRHVLIHVAACGSFVLAYLLLRTTVGLWQARLGGQRALFFELFEIAAVKTVPQSLLVYWAVVAVQHVVAFQARAHERERRAAELEQRLTAARLQALQMQLNPHFLFNTLNAISSLMHQDVDAADRMLVRLSELLRRALDTRDRQEVPLGEELAFLRRYLEIEQTRFGSRLTVEQKIDESLLDVLVPNLVLQPLVENAIKHGISHCLEGGLIRLEARAGINDVILTLTNTYDPDAPKRTGSSLGHENIRRRLETLYEGGARLSTSATETTYRAEIRLLKQPPEQHP